jgi:hypothetical protein
MEKKRIMKNIIAVLAAIAMLISVAGAAVDTVVSIENVQVSNTGDTVPVTINISNVTNLGAVDIWLTYDKNVVTVESVSDGNMGSVTNGIDNPNGTTKMNWFSASGKTGDFEFAEVTLKAVGTAGQTSDLNLTVKEIVDANGTSIDNTVIDGKFTIGQATEPVLTNITVSPTTVCCVVGNTTMFTATPLDQFGNPITVIVTWTSSNTTVGTIDDTGNFTALAEGTTTITASNGSIEGNATAQVTATSILSFYRGLGADPDVVETTDLLKAADDWSRDIPAPGFICTITTQQLLMLADEWSKS